MAEADGSSIGGGAGEYQPRHAAEQLDFGLMEALVHAADQYRYQQMHEEFDAKFALVRARLFMVDTVDDHTFNEYVETQRWRIARAIGRQAMAKAYADSLRTQVYDVLREGEQPYRGRHRQEDLEMPVSGSEEVAEVPVQHNKPPEPEASKEGESKPPNVPERGRLRHIITDDRQVVPSPRKDPPEEPKEEEKLSPVPVQKERGGVFARLRRAWYAAGAAVSAFFAHPEKGGRRRAIVRTAAILGGVAAVLAAAEIADRAGDQIVQPPAPEPLGPAPNTEEFFDTLKPDNYNGEPYEWAAAANHVGPAEATPKLLQLIDHARHNGLTVDTWGDPARGRWGITNVTVHLPDGAAKSYYDTPHKLAILKWYAGGMAQGFRS
ncbi:hypothetical protein IRY61_04755 [Candidatus Saccharibacteria bacterium]|nr:hypothetical protein [Candidatus Saccharibacteria bacterium]